MTNIPTKFQPGSKASVRRTIDDQTVQEFAQLSGDTQPLHLDDAYASKTRFGKRIAHGALLVGMVSAVLGVEMAGQDATIIFLGMNANFTNPVYIGDTVTAQCEVVNVRDDKPIVKLAVSCTNQDDTEVMNGEAIVYIDPHPITKP